MKKKSLTLSVAALLCFTGSSFAGVIYSNLGPGNSFGGDYTSVHPTLPFSDAVRFVAGTSGALADVLVPVGDVNGLLTFDLYQDSGGQPGTLLESWTNVTVPTDPLIPTLLSLTSAAQPFLSSGTQYWFVATSAPIVVSPSFGLFWSASTQVSSGGFWSSTNGGPFTGSVDLVPPAIRLDSNSAAPEPATWAMLGCGLLGLVVRRRRVTS
jgi:hypothetical protein